MTGGVIGAFTLLLTNYLVVRFLFRHRRLDQVMEGRSTVMIENRHLHRRALAPELLTESELLLVAHRQGFTSLQDLERCVLEPGGGHFICKANLRRSLNNDTQNCWRGWMKSVANWPKHNSSCVICRDSELPVAIMWRGKAAGL